MQAEPALLKTWVIKEEREGGTEGGRQRWMEGGRGGVEGQSPWWKRELTFCTASATLLDSSFHREEVRVESDGCDGGIGDDSSPLVSPGGSSNLVDRTWDRRPRSLWCSGGGVWERRKEVTDDGVCSVAQARGSECLEPPLTHFKTKFLIMFWIQLHPTCTQRLYVDRDKNSTLNS